MSRPLAAADPFQRTDDPAPLTTLPGLYEQLLAAVRTRRLSAGSGFGSAIPIRLDVVALLYSSDHLGRLGIVPGLAAMEHVTRLALGDSLPGAASEAETVDRAARYLAVQVDRLLTQGSWTPQATAAVAALVDEVLSRIDPAAVQLDWEQARKRAERRIVEIDNTEIIDDTHHDDLQAQRASCVAMVAMDYIDFEGQLYDAITARFMGAAQDPFEWYGFIVAETAWMSAAARSLLGLSEHSQRRLAACPMQCGGAVGLSDDPDVANCDTCSWTSPISDGQADAWFKAFRDSGWAPQRVA